MSRFSDKILTHIFPRLTAVDFMNHVPSFQGDAASMERVVPKALNWYALEAHEEKGGGRDHDEKYHKHVDCSSMQLFCVSNRWHSEYQETSR